ncbi:hypothetical protein QR680_010940 [Steinernema hermaphroditum]|uniref:Structural maintenance of chromosomes protein 5 n=1 Tax=Steinernema hermaphroditum TaxID=289476 RepID=A0AA39MC02_9BILA|nr:hypothetical protein QR680_010940 [Steinernema hermaphroditum]
MDEDDEMRYSINDYAVGSITKVELTNFLTYDHGCYYPSPNLNVIIGSNGTGKSSVLCGICLAVGGKPALLGRSDRMDDYVKHGKQEGWVEVTIRDHNESKLKKFRIVLRKGTGSKADCTTEYFIDGRKVTHKVVNEVIKEFNIQIDNPCTFLAQDKVKSFSEQNSQKLLENTQKALGVGLYGKYTELCGESKKGNDVEQEKRKLEAELERIKKTISDLEPRVQAFHEQELRNRHINKLKECVAYLEAQAAFEHYQNEVSTKKDKENTLQKKMKDEEKVKRTIATLDQKLRQSRFQFGKEKEKMNDMEEELYDLLRERKLGDEIAENQKNFEIQKTKFDDWENERAVLEERIAGFRQNWKEVNDAYVPKDFSQEDQALSEEKDRVVALKEEIRRQYEQVKNKEQYIIRQGEQSKRALRSKIEHLQSERSVGHLQILQAYQFYKNNLGSFKYPVYIPFLDIFLKDRSAPRYLCNTVSIRDMAMFIFGCEDDERLMHSQRFKINTTIMKEEQRRQYEGVRPQISSSMRNMGFTNFLSEMIEAPDVVMAFLMANSSIHQIPIGTDRLNHKLEEVAAKIGDAHPLIFTPKIRCHTKYSPFTGDPIIRIDQLRDQSYFVNEHFQPSETDLTDVKREYRELKEKERGAVEERINAYTEKQRRYFEEREVEKRKQTELRTLKHKLEAECVKLDCHLDVRPEVEHAQKALEERNEMCKRKALQRGEKRLQILEALSKKIIELGEAAVSCHEAESHLDEQRTKETAVQLEMETIREEIAYLAREFRQAEEAFQRSNARFSDICHIPSVDPSELNGSHKRKLKELTEYFEKEGVERDVTALQNRIDQEIARNNVAGVTGSATDVERHTKSLEEKEKIDGSIRELREKLTISEAQLSEKLDAWREPVKHLVEKISDNFTKFFSQLNCIGEVKLCVPENEYHMEEYGIDIYVKFRENASLRRLDDKSQSGGERSVSTMLYMLALQELCPVPFRCVDEINQGMDPRNERKVFEMMLDILASEGSLAKTQYFLLTPKLLHGLRYNDKVRVGIIFNSPVTVTDNIYKSSLRTMLADVEESN